MTPFKQDLSEHEEQNLIYTISLLFEDKPETVPFEIIKEAMLDKFQNVDVVANTENMYTFALLDYEIQLDEENYAPVMVSLMHDLEILEPIGNEMDRSQFWDVVDAEIRLDACKYQVILTDFFASTLDPLERANLLMDYLEVVQALYPTCKLVYYGASRKLLTYEDSLNNPYEGPVRIIWGGCNARFFNIEGKDEAVVDTLGLDFFDTSDIQYHFKHDDQIDINDLIYHAYNLAIYQFTHRNPILSSETVPGLKENQSWRCQYETALIQPVRTLLDVEMNEHAAGIRTSNLKH